MMKIKHYCKYYILFILVIVIFNVNYSVKANDTKRVLYICSYNSNFPTISKTLNAIKSTLDEEIVVDIEFMDTKRFYTDENLSGFYESMRYKINSLDKYDTIIAAHDNALDFVMKYQDELFVDIPIIYFGVSNVEKAIKASENHMVTGVVEAVSLDETISLAIELFPDAKNVIALTDSTTTGQSELKNFYNISNRFNTVNFSDIDLSDLTFEEWEKELANIDENNILIYLSIYKDKTGKTMDFIDGVNHINRNTKLPVFHIYEFGIGQGLFGGKVISFSEQGRLASEMLEQVFKGNSIDNIPMIYKSPNQYIFDYNLIKEFNIDTSLLPKSSLFLNKEKSFYELYFEIVWIVIGIFLFLITLIFFMQRNIIRRKKAEEELIRSNEELAASEEELKAQFDEIQQNREKILKSEERYKLIFEASDGGLWDADFSSHEIYLSEKWYNTFFDAHKDFRKSIKHWRVLIHKEDRELHDNAINSVVLGKENTYSCEYRILTRNKEYIWIHENGIALRDDKGVLLRLAGSHTNIHKQKLHQEKIKYLAYYDSLTGLVNMSALNIKIDELISKSQEINKSGAVMFLDIDNFSFINDTFGHRVGDEVLKQIGSRLRKIENDTTFIGRYSGDEFVVISEDVDNHDKAKAVVNVIQNIFEENFIVDNNEFYLTLSIGIVFYPKDGNNMDDLLKNGDLAMYRAKEMGKNCYYFYEKALSTKLCEKMLLQNSLRNALERDEFSLNYQPQIDGNTGNLIGFEALIRWFSNEHGFIPPDKFINIAEEMGIIIKIGQWVLKNACQFSKKINESSKDKYVISVNISSVQLKQADFVDLVKQVLLETGLNPELLGLEITETALMESFKTNAKKIRILKEMGIQISLDDFGTGYSSLNYLRQLPINTIKIDKSFIDDLCQEKVRSNLTESIIIIAHKMALDVVAEGVETNEQLDILKNFRCDMIQGYLFSKPLTEDKAIEFLTKN